MKPGHVTGRAASRLRGGLRLGAAGSALALAAGLVGMTGSAGAAPAGATTRGSAARSSSVAPHATTTTFGAANGPACDGLDTTQCMLPFPNNYYTKTDSATVTGRQVDLPSAGFPAGTGQPAFAPTLWNANDGFSPGASLLTHVPGISLAESKVATISDMGASLAASSPVVVIDATTGKRWPTWTELDVLDHDPTTQLLMVHPAKDFTEGHRYLVALRNLKTASGQAIPPVSACMDHVEGLAVHQPADQCNAPAAYLSHLKQVVAELGEHGVAKNGLFEAWDFTVASRQNLTGPALAMRNEAFATLGTGVPAYTVSSVVTDPSTAPQSARKVVGTFTVPSFLDGVEGTAGTVLTEGSNGLPVQVGGATQTANFTCDIPKAATPAHPASVGYYGHGLFGTSTEVFHSGVPGFSNTYDYMFCSTDWIGLAKPNLLFAATVVANLSNFPSLADNLLQALVNAQFLGRLEDSPKGFATNPAFQATGKPVVRAGHGLVYYGNSQGGIMGGAFLAISQDARRGVLGVPAIDYDVLLNRSVDFSTFETLLTQAYPTHAVQEVGLDLIQMLWDRAEGDGYAEQMTGGLPGTPQHQVMLEEAFGDHQVANVQTETEARTIGAAVHQPALKKGRSPEAQPFWDIPTLKPGSKGPALFVWDSGVPPPPLTNTPPTAGHDPHDTTPRTDPKFWRQMDTFFETGKVITVCGGKACTAPYPPTPGTT